MRRSQEDYQSLVEHAPVGIYRASVTEDRFLSVNPALIRMLGYDSAEDLKKLKLSTDLYLLAADRERLLRESDSHISYTGFELQWKRKDGTALMMRLSGRIIREDGEVVAHEVVAEDVSEHYSLEQQLRQAQKMEAVGRLAGGIAHDFNNLLTIVSSYAELISGQTEDARLQAYAANVLSAAKKASELTRQLLAFGRKQILDLKLLDMNALLADLCKLIPRMIGEDIELSFLPGDDLHYIKADPAHMEQVLMNLIVNARDAMPQGGKLLLETNNMELDEAFARLHVDVPSGSYVMITVSDTGIGMTPETKSRIFEPFFTTKESGKGTGLGLATVYGIIKQSGGFISVYSEPLKGTALKIYLPAAHDEGGERFQRAAKDPQIETGSGLVLLVEDDPGVRSVTKELLEGLGYTVCEAANAAEAILCAEQRKERIAVLLVDIVLPGIRGPELVARLKKLRPESRVMYMSGYSDKTQQVQELGSDAEYLQKPFTIAALSQKLKKAISRS